jgi:hypothetical protein
MMWKNVTGSNDKYGHRLLSMFITVLLLLIAGICGAAENTSLIIPKGTIFRVKILDSLNSNINRKGDQVRLEVAEDVVVKGVVVILKGTRDLATVGEVYRPGLFRAQGYIKISAGSFRTFNNVEVPVHIGKAVQGSPSETERLLGALIPTVNTSTGSGSGSGSSSFNHETGSGSANWSSSSSSFSFGLNPGCLIPGHEAHIDAGAEIYVNTDRDVDLGITSESAPSGDKSAAITEAGAAVAAESSAPSIPTPSPTPSQAFTLKNVLVCRGISDEGDPVGVNNIFTGDLKSLSIWCDFESPGTDTLLESKWYCEGQFLRAKQLFIDADRNPRFASGSIYAGAPLPRGRWRVDLLLNERVLKSSEFVIR